MVNIILNILMTLTILLFIIIFIYRKNEGIWVSVLVGLSSLIGLYAGIDIRFIILWSIILAIFYVLFRKLTILDFMKVFGLSMIITFAMFILVTFHYESGTSVEIREYDIQGDYVSNITLEELSRYPELEKMLNDEAPADCTKYPGYTNCKINPEEWNKIREFINSKAIIDSGRRSGRGTCYKFGEKYGDKCFMFAFVTP